MPSLSLLRMNIRAKVCPIYLTAAKDGKEEGMTQLEVKNHLLKGYKKLRDIQPDKFEGVSDMVKNCMPHLGLEDFPAEYGQGDDHFHKLHKLAEELKTEGHLEQNPGYGFRFVKLLPE